jgi:uncharacterized protein (TIGR02594 family)
MSKSDIRRMQLRLAELGYEPGPADGIMGPRTKSAIIAFKRANGLRPRAYVGPITWATLFDEPTEKAQPRKSDPLPWIAEGMKAYGRHEHRDNAWLTRWLRSDGHALGDPAKYPWCGDFIETAIRLSLPNEPIPQNPYWALNWRKFGVPTQPTRGSIASIPRSGGGHVMFILGYDRGRYIAIGGNQSDTVSIVPVDASRFEPESFRWPATYPQQPISLPRMTVNQAANWQEA